MFSFQFIGVIIDPNKLISYQNNVSYYSLSPHKYKAIIILSWPKFTILITHHFIFISNSHCSFG